MTCFSYNDYGSYQVNRGILELIEPKKDELIDLPLEIEKDDFDKTIELIKIVYKNIRDLDFPDTSGYNSNLKGIIAFENDLIHGKI